MKINGFKKIKTTSLTVALACLASSLVVFSPPSLAQSGRTEILWFGQAGFKIKTPGGKTIV